MAAVSSTPLEALINHLEMLDTVLTKVQAAIREAILQVQQGSMKQVKAQHDFVFLSRKLHHMQMQHHILAQEVQCRLRAVDAIPLHAPTAAAGRLRCLASLSVKKQSMHKAQIFNMASAVRKAREDLDRCKEMTSKQRLMGFIFSKLRNSTTHHSYMAQLSKWLEVSSRTSTI